MSANKEEVVRGLWNSRLWNSLLRKFADKKLEEIAHSPFHKFNFLLDHFTLLSILFEQFGLSASVRDPLP